MAEQLAFDELRRDGAAIDREKRLEAPTTHVMDRLSDHFLPCAAVTGNEHRRIGRCDPLDRVVQLLHRLRAADQRAEVSKRTESIAKPRDLRAQLHRPSDP